MENGGNGFDRKLTNKLSRMELNDPSNISENSESLFQVMKAVEAAEATIRKQVEENDRLKTKLQDKIQELEKHKSNQQTRRWGKNVDETYGAHESTTSVGNPEVCINSKSLRRSSLVDQRGSPFPHNESSRVNGTMKLISSGQIPAEVPVLAQFASPSSSSISLGRYQTEAENDPKSNSFGYGLMPVAGANNSSGQIPAEVPVLAQFASPSSSSISLGRYQTEAENDPKSYSSGYGLMPVAGANNSSGQIPAEVPVLAQFASPSSSSISLGRYQTEVENDLKSNSSGHGLMPAAGANNSNSFPEQVQEHEEEIAQLRRYLVEFSLREAQIRNEKSVLEKRIAIMRLAFDQQQHDIVDAASKAISYRQEIMEENIRLSYQLQAAQQERMTFVSSLVPLLAEYSLQPPVPDAQSIVSNVKILFKHLKEQLHITESRLKDSQFRLTPWPPVGGAAQNQDGHEQVINGNSIPSRPPPSSSSNAQMPVRMDGITEHPTGLGVLLQRNTEHDEMRRHPIPRSLHREYDNARRDAQRPRPSEEPPKQVKFRVPVSIMDDPNAEVHLNEPGSLSYWAPGINDPSSSHSPYLQPVLEEPSSSFSEGPDDDPLPAVDGLQISGDAVPGRELLASGYSINGTTSCNFEWVRHIADGSVKYIEGAKHPNYLVTADDVDNYLAIEVQPLDNRKRKGEPVKVFANDNRKISLEPGMQAWLTSANHNGGASFRVEISTGYLDIWEPAILTIKRDGYSIRSNTPNGVNVTEKFTRDTIVTIPFGHPTTFSISDPNYEDNLLRSETGPEDVSNCRDTIVLILRLFIMRVGQKPNKGRRKGLFFKK